MAFLMGCPLKVVAFPASFLPPLTSKKPAMVVKCYTGNQRGEARMKSQLGTCHTNFNRLYSNKKNNEHIDSTFQCFISFFFFQWFKLQQKPSKNLCFFPGKRTMNTSGLNSSKNKHPPMQLVCKSNNGT
ncbi:hypothetical protein Bca4012_001495 [Brassica carinata]